MLSRTGVHEAIGATARDPETAASSMILSLGTLPRYSCSRGRSDVEPLFLHCHRGRAPDGSAAQGTEGERYRRPSRSVHAHMAHVPTGRPRSRTQEQQTAKTLGRVNLYPGRIVLGRPVIVPGAPLLTLERVRVEI